MGDFLKALLTVAMVVIVIAGAMLWAVIMGLLYAWVIRDIWGWFIAGPLGLPKLPFLTAYAMTLIFYMLIGQLARAKHEDEDTKTKKVWGYFSRHVLAPLAVWLTAYLLHRYGAPWPWNGVA